LGYALLCSPLGAATAETGPAAALRLNETEAAQ
jgi:hypothetical protein